MCVLLILSIEGDTDFIAFKERLFVYRPISANYIKLQDLHAAPIEIGSEWFIQGVHMNKVKKNKTGHCIFGYSTVELLQKTCNISIK